MGNNISLKTNIREEGSESNIGIIIAGGIIGIAVGILLADKNRRIKIWQKVKEVDEESLDVINYVKEKSKEYRDESIRKLKQKNAEFVEETPSN